MHQFFTCWEETKRVAKSISASNRENYYYSAHDEDVFLGSPIHIFDKVEDESIGLHWQNWVFKNKTPDSDGSYDPKHASSVFESSVKPLELDTACHSQRHPNQMLAKPNLITSVVASSSLPEHEQVGQLVTDNGGNSSNSTSSIYLPFRCSNSLVDMETEKDCMLVKERLDSYNLRRGNFPESSLWTDKYQPENTLELCGNIKSVRILGEWLKSWDEGPRSNRSFNSSVKDGHHSSYDIESYMDDTDDEAVRKNVLLLTGPIGSGKSAAIHACTKEQGFEVIEVNTSDVRSGALMKQKFGDSIEASAITPSLCLKDNPIGERKKIIPALSSGIIDIDDTDDSFSQRTSENCQQGKIATGGTQKLVEKKNTNSWKVKGSIQVFEDVDVVFCEDMGFISAVLQLAEKTKKPIILTSNDKNPILPHLDPLIVDFTVPLYEDLLSHAQMVCAVEGIHMSSELLERLISYCRGDIRKMLMFLQFWCQGTRCQIDDSKRCTYNPLPFDVSAAHLIMPRVIPWDFPCDLSEKIEEEISGSISLFENLCLEDAKEHILCTIEMIDSSKIGNYNRNRNSKKSILKQKCSFPEFTDFSVDADRLEDFLDASDTPEELAQQRVKRRRCIILSSQSDDDPSTDEVLPRENITVNHNSLILHDMRMPINIDVKEVHNQARPSSSMVCESKMEDTICDTSGLQDVSCVPESSFACAIDANKEVDSLSVPDYASQTSVNLSDCPLVPVHSRADIDYMNDSVSESNKLSEDNIGYNCEVYLESVYGDEDVVMSHEHEEPQALSRSVVMDESGHVGSNMLAPIKSSTPVQQKWQKLKSCREDLKSCLNSNHKDAYSIIKLSSQLTDLISQTDVMINGCNAVFSDILDRSIMLSDGSDDFSRDDRQFEMGSTYAQHGFCFYANKCAATGSSFGSQTTLDLAHEMLASSTNVMALGKLLTTPNLSWKGTLVMETMKIGSEGRELESELFNAILPKVPTRVSVIKRACIP
ncbi:uncharacterized protein LOC120249661 isoform X5 [Dioscorea cayenensis subsp. rotundata]|nr:uncharacterized protein LOC120249661 isoform X5 [Dioscorea cayenensis subsp. rotundata]XP_039114183.1 uncharacterized protein LOC120249661 isoform X5 [Dioscorea cayenensis subsp. rotundata]XP_039114184.1 uncharacterized protein LOC120249661 isoform X5 [Dioscorea cayenensis subsp. rotundata]